MIKISSQDEYAKTSLRLPVDLRKEIQDAAERNGRSMNAEIIARLRTVPIAEQLGKLSADNTEIKSLAREILGAINAK